VWMFTYALPLRMSTSSEFNITEECLRRRWIHGEGIERHGEVVSRRGRVRSCCWRTASASRGSRRVITARRCGRTGVAQHNQVA
jgi:hypothetical protein